MAMTSIGKIPTGVFHLKENMFTQEDLRNIMERMLEDKPEWKRRFEFLEKLRPFFGKTKEELEELIPDGAYMISDNLMTGKGGLIQYILMIQEPIRPWQ